MTKNINKTTVVSVVVGLAIFGIVTYVAVASGVAPIVKAANVVKGG